MTCRPADLLAPELDALREEVKVFSQKDEDVLSYALFPKVAMDFFRNRDAKANKIDPGVYDLANKAYPV